METQGKEIFLGFYPGLIERGKYQGYYSWAIDIDNSENTQTLGITEEKCRENGVWFEPSRSKGHHVYGITKTRPINEKLHDLKLELLGENSFVVVYNNFSTDLCELQPNDVMEIFNGFKRKIAEHGGMDISSVASKPAKVENIEADCIINILQGVNKGKRNDTAFVLANWYFNIKRLSATETRTLVKEWNKSNTPPLPESETDVIIDSALDTDKITGCSKIKQLGFCPYVDQKQCKFVQPEQKSISELLEKYYVFIKDGNGVVKEISTPRLARLIMDEYDYHFVTMKDTGMIYYYNGSFYSKHGEQIIKTLVNLYLGDYTSEHRKNEIVGYIRDEKYIDSIQFNPSPHLINLKNGVFNLDTSELMPHSPDYYFLYEIEIDYDPRANFSEFETFLRQICNNDDEIRTLQEYMGYILYRKYIYKKYLILDGGGDNGKTTFMQILLNWIGSGNNTSVSLQELNENKFARSKFFGKHTNISDDLPKRAVKYSGIIKQITGDSPMWGDIKNHKEGINFLNYAKPIYACNEIPPAEDDTDAFFSRLLLITFKKKFLPKGSPEIDNVTVFEADPHLVEKLSKPEQLSGMLNFAIEGLKRLAENGHFTMNPTVAETREIYKKKTNPTLAYCDEDIEFMVDWGITCDDFYKQVLYYCDEKQLDHPTKTSVTQRIYQANLPVEKQQRRINGKTTWCWVGMRSASNSQINHYFGKQEQRMLGGDE